jgi:hypothetical protein
VPKKVPYDQRRTRGPQEVEVYQTLYYDAKIKPVMDTRFAGQTLSSGQRLSEMRKISWELYEEESDEVKAEVKAKLQERIQEAERVRAEKAERSVSGVRTPQEYQQ